MVCIHVCGKYLLYFNHVCVHYLVTLRFFVQYHRVCLYRVQCGLCLKSCLLV